MPVADEPVVRAIIQVAVCAAATRAAAEGERCNNGIAIVPWRLVERAEIDMPAP